MNRGTNVSIERVDVSAYTVPTDSHESDGTLDWDSTTIVVVEAHAGEARGLGYTYAPAAAASVVKDVLAPIATGRDALAVGGAWELMARGLREAGRPGIGFSALAAVDTALWDLKAKLLEVPLHVLLDPVRDAVPVYASGGFTSYPPSRLTEQVTDWVEAGIPRVKIKVGRSPEQDPRRLDAASEAVEGHAELFVDANGALNRKQAVAWAERFSQEWGVTWFEEPVSSADLEGLRLVRDRAPAPMEIAAGEYAYAAADFRTLLDAGAVDVLQADVTRCGGITGFLRVGALCDAAGIDLSGHGAPQLHAHVCCAVPRVRHLEWFHDHVRVERLLFDGVLEPQHGVLWPDRTRPGNGLELKRNDAAAYAA